jgi:putative DNA-invertase from lambdoid prophage Rac
MSANRVAYYRVSTSEQSIASQRTAMGGQFCKEFSDEGVSGVVQAAQRPGFAAALKFLREGDTLCVYAVDRLGRDSIDIQTTVRDLMRDGVSVYVHGLGVIEGDAGKLILTMFAQLAEMERARIKERCDAGRETARQALAATGRTHRGKESLGRPMKADARTVKAWRESNEASIAQTGEQFGLSVATVKRYCAA